VEKVYTIEDLRQVAIEILASGDRGDIRKALRVILNKYCAANISALPINNYNAFMADLALYKALLDSNKMTK